MVPPLLVNDLLRLLRVLIIPLKDVGSLDAHLSLVILRPVFHLGHVHQLHAATGDRRSHVTRDVVPLDGQGDRRRAFCLAIPFYDLETRFVVRLDIFLSRKKTYQTAQRAPDER